MSLKNYLAFASGELDPTLHDRVTLDRFGKGLETARNVIVSKTGSIHSRFTTAFFKTAKNADEEIVIHVPEDENYVIELGPSYIRVHDFEGTTFVDTSTVYAATNLESVQFFDSKGVTYILVEGLLPSTVNFNGSPSYLTSGFLFAMPSAPYTLAALSTSGPPAGYDVDYIVTAVKNGQETEPYVLTTGAPYKLPISAGHYNQFQVRVIGSASSSGPIEPNELRFYRRPTLGGAYGFIGSTTDFTSGVGYFEGTFVDFGGNADFTNRPPTIVTKDGLLSITIANLKPKSGVRYQQRDVFLNVDSDSEGVVASRPTYTNNFYRDYPIDADSALYFKCDGKILRSIDKDGLIVFTSTGTYTSVGLLNATNLGFEKRGDWIINEKIQPLVLPSGVFFVDTENTIRQLVFNRDITAYETMEQSIFSNHLFRNRTIESWCFQKGNIPMIIVTFSDGKFATFTYQFEHQMKAWTRHDTNYPVEQVAGSNQINSSFFVVNKNGQRHIHVTLPRFVPAATFVSNPEADKLNLNMFADAVKTQSTLMNDSLMGADEFQVVPVTPSDYEGSLTLTCGTSGLFTVGGLGIVGTIFRFFDVNDKSMVDLEVTARTSDNEVTVTPSAEFPSAQASGFRLYQTFTEVTGLDHLEGENVSIFADGYVLNSPNNDVDGYTAVTVSSGTITLPDSYRAAICVVGRPITADIKTLNVSTLSQSPTIVESLNVNKLYVRVKDSRGLYVSNQFPEEDLGQVDGTSVTGMEDQQIFYKPKGGFVGNRYDQPVSLRKEIALQGNWESQGKIAVRQVDPLHFEILSLIPDIDVLNRSNRR